MVLEEEIKKIEQEMDAISDKIWALVKEYEETSDIKTATGEAARKLEECGNKIDNTRLSLAKSIQILQKKN